MRARTPTERYAAAFSPPVLHNLLTDQGVEYRTVDSRPSYNVGGTQRTGDDDHGQGRNRAPPGPGRTGAAGLQDPGAAGVQLDRRHPRVVSIWFHWDGS